MPSVEILEDDVAAVLRHGRAHAGFEQFLDLRDDLVVFLGVRGGFGRRGAGGDRPGGRR